MRDAVAVWSRAGLCAFLLTTVCVAGGGAVSAQQQSPAYYDIQPGSSTRAQVELRYGQPVKRVSQDAPVYEYAPPPEDADSTRIVITFDADTQQVSRVDAYLNTYLPSDIFRDKFGTRIAARDRADGGREEFYYPQLQALIFSERTPDAPVTAVSFVSPRTLAGVFARRFEAALEQKAYEEARTEADKAVAVDPSGGEGYNAQGRLFAALGDADEALVRFTAAANAHHSQHDRYAAHLWMADIYTNLKKSPEKARAEYLVAVDIAPRANRSDARLKYSRFLKAQGQNDEALAELIRAVETESAGSGEARRVLAETYWDKGDYASALPHYEALSRLADNAAEDVRNATVYARYGQALRRAGKPTEAMAAYEKSLQESPKQLATLTDLALLYMGEGGDPAKAVEVYREALAIAPSDHTANRNLIDALYETGQIDEARHQAELTLTLMPNDSGTMFALARCWGELKNKKAALIWVQRAVDAGFSDRQALLSDPAFELVRDDRIFRRLLQQLG